MRSNDLVKCSSEQHKLWVCMCRGLSFANVRNMYIPAQTNVTIECPHSKPFFPMHLYSNVTKTHPFLDRTAILTFVGCNVIILPDIKAAANDPPSPVFSANYFGGSEGNVVLSQSRFLMGSEVRSSPLTHESFFSKVNVAMLRVQL
jgi:hypothetical protein